MLNHVVAAVGVIALSAAVLPQVASAQSTDRNGFGQAGRGGPDEFRMHGGHGQFGGGQRQFGGGQRQFGGGQRQFGGGEGARFHNEYRPFGSPGGMALRGPDDYRLHGERGRFGGDQSFRFGQEHRNLGYGQDLRIRHAQEHFGYGDQFRGGRGFDYRHDFGAREVRHGYRFGVIRPYPVYRHRFGEVGFGMRYARPAVLLAGYGFPRAGCTSHRSVSFTPVGWRKIVTVQTCYVR